MCLCECMYHFPQAVSITCIEEKKLHQHDLFLLASAPGETALAIIECVFVCVFRM